MRLKVGSASTFHCCSTNAPNAMTGFRPAGALVDLAAAVHPASPAHRAASARSATEPSSLSATHPSDGAVVAATRPRASAIDPHLPPFASFDKAVLSEIFDEPRLTSLRKWLALRLWSVERYRRKAGAVNGGGADVRRFGAFCVDVGAQIARVEAEILPELHDRQTVLGLRPHVLVDPRHRDLEESSGVLRSEERVVSWRRC